MRGFTFTSVIVLVVVVAVVGVAAVLLARTVQEAQSINDKAQNIATTGQGINLATDSVIQLNRTNELARSILRTARPLDTQLGRIVSTAQGIDTRAASINSRAGSINTTARSINDSAGSINTNAGEINSAAGSINSSASSINSTAGEINTSAGAINTSARQIAGSAGTINQTASAIDEEAASILSTARDIDTDVNLINQNLDVSLRLVTAVKSDTGDILGQAVAANQTAACIDFKLHGQAGDDGDCQGQSQASPTERKRDVSAKKVDSPKELRQLLKAPPPAPKAKKRKSQSKLPKVPELPLRTSLPELPKQSTDIIERLLPGLRQGKDPLAGLRQSKEDRDERPPRDLLRQLMPGLLGR